MSTPGADRFADDFFATFTSSAWRLELLDDYDDAETRLRVAQFKNGHVPPMPAFWLNGLRSAILGGKTMGRVHVIGHLTDYLRYELAMYQQSTDAGEDIRILPAERALALDLPTFDYWLLDDRRVIRMNYGPRGRFASRELISDTGIVARCAAARDAAMEAAEPLQAYVEREAA